MILDHPAQNLDKLLQEIKEKREAILLYPIFEA
jgi:hypothetical protein